MSIVEELEDTKETMISCTEHVNSTPTIWLIKDLVYTGSRTAVLFSGYLFSHKTVNTRN